MFILIIFNKKSLTHRGSEKGSILNNITYIYAHISLPLTPASRIIMPLSRIYALLIIMILFLKRCKVKEKIVDIKQNRYFFKYQRNIFA